MDLTVVLTLPNDLRVKQRGSTASFGSSYYRRAGMPRPPPRVGALPRSSTARQSIRTGGWHNPSSGSERKFTDVAGTATALGLAAATFTTPGPTFLLNGLVPDSTATGRIGRQVVLKSVYLRYRYTMAATSTNGSPMRLIIVYDKQANAQAPAVTDVLLSDSFTSPNNLSNRDRFVILADHVAEPISAQNNFCVAGEIYKKINLEVNFNPGTAGTIGDITSGSVYLLMAQAGGIGTAAPTVDWRCRIRYTDN